MLRYDILYLWFRLRKNTPCQARGKVARFITRKIKEPTWLTLKKVRGEEY